MQAMDLAPGQLIALLEGVLALLVVSQAAGSLAQRLGQARVIGEIGGGILLGPMVLGALCPRVYQTIFAGSPAHGPVLGFLFQLGLLLFMFAAGLEGRGFRGLSNVRTVASLTLVGSLLPLAIGLGLASWPGWAPYRGPAATSFTFAVFFALCVAATAIPVISKLLMDLGLLGRPFGQTILAVAFIEDALLWLAMAALLGDHTAAGYKALTLGATAATFVGMLGWGHSAYDALARSPINVLRGGPPLLGPLVGLLATVVVTAPLGVTPIFAAFLAGHMVAHATSVSDEARTQLGAFAASLFVPLFFAGVGLRLDLRAGVDVVALVGVVALAMATKIAAVFVGARLVGESNATSFHLGMALNARGAVGIVLATVGLEAHLITSAFHVVLVLTALASTQLAGWWLQRAVRLAPDELEMASERLALHA